MQWCITNFTRFMARCAVCTAALMCTFSTAVLAQRLPDSDTLTPAPGASSAATQPATPAVPIENLPHVQVDPALRDAAAQLDDPSFTVRDQATDRLMDKAIDTPQLYALLAGNDLTPEQRYRLLAILQTRLLKSPRGAIGIRMAGLLPGAMPPNGPVEIRVDDLLPGLPAEKVLQIGDTITAVDGRVLTRSDELINYVQMKQPGDKVTLTVRRTRIDDRGKKVLDERNLPVTDTIPVELALGSADLLQLPGQFQAQSLVERARTEEARNATNTFSPKPRTVSIEGEDQMMFSSSSAALRNSARLDPVVERYWAIQQLLREQRLFREGGRQPTPEVKAQWLSRLQYLIDLSQQPGRSADDREFLQRVIERFAQLLNPEVAPDNSP